MVIIIHFRRSKASSIFTPFRCHHNNHREKMREWELEQKTRVVIAVGLTRLLRLLFWPLFYGYSAKSYISVSGYPAAPIVKFVIFYYLFICLYSLYDFKIDKIIMLNYPTSLIHDKGIRAVLLVISDVFQYIIHVHFKTSNAKQLVIQ